MAIITTFTEVNSRLADYLHVVTEYDEVVIINRDCKKSVALISARELSGLIETVHLLKSCKNAARLHSALQRARKV